MEMMLGNVNRCRKLFEEYLLWKPENWDGWVEYAEFERVGGDRTSEGTFRTRHQAGGNWSVMNRPVWMAYIRFEISEGEVERTRQLFERLLECSNHVKVWIDYAKFEAENRSIEHARRVFSRAADCFRFDRTEENRRVLRQQWLCMEASFGDLCDISLILILVGRKMIMYVLTEGLQICKIPSDQDFPSYKLKFKRVFIIVLD